jgi:putative hydrolase of the HAD superfamily
MGLISFDAAGTLIQVREPVAATYVRMAADHGIIADPVRVKEAFRSAWARLAAPHWPEGQPSPDDDRSWWQALVSEVFAQALGEALPPDRLARLFEELYEHYAHAEAWSVFDDVAPALEALRRDHVLCVLSNFDRRLRAILRGHGLAHYFEHIILSSEVGASKPHPRMFAMGERLHGKAPHECLHVGDDARCDIEGAANAGWHAFKVDRPGLGLKSLVEKVSRGEYSGLHQAHS